MKKERHACQVFQKQQNIQSFSYPQVSSERVEFSTFWTSGLNQKLGSKNNWMATTNALEVAHLF